MSAKSKIALALTGVWAASGMAYNQLYDQSQAKRRRQNILNDIERNREKLELREKNKALQDAQIALRKALEEKPAVNVTNSNQ